MEKKILFLIGLILTVSLLWPLVVAPYFTHHDDVQSIRIYELNECVKDLQIPCRWDPNLGGLYGYPLFNYYAPLPYYTGEVFYLITSNLLLSSKIIFAIPFILSYIFMFLLAKRFWGNWGASLSGVFYSFAPYHSVVMYVRGAMGELWALAFFPAVLWSLFRLKDQKNIFNLLLLALTLALLILSHNLSTMVFLPIFILFSLWNIFQEKDIKFLKYLIFSTIIGIALAAFYLGPMVLEKNLVHVETTTSGYFSYTEHFKGLQKLILERTWGWGSSIREIPGGEKDGMSFQIGWVHIGTWLLSLVAAIWLWKKSKEKSILIILSSLVIVGSIFMINPRSVFIWNLFEPLKFIQFPWRFLMFIIFFISLISGSVILTLKNIWQKVVFVVLMILVVGLNFSYFRPENFIQITDQQLLSGKSWDKLIKRSIFDFLPIYAKAPPAELASNNYEIKSGIAEITNFKKGSNWMKFNLNVKETITIQLSQYYFPNWTINANQEKVGINYDNDLGLITFQLSPGIYNIEGKLEDTLVRTISNFISLFGIVAFIGLFTWRKIKNG